MSKDQRKYARLTYEVDIVLTMGDRQVEGRSINLSQGGILVSMPEVPPFGSKLSLRMEIPGIGEPCEIPCIVRWAKPGEGVGLQFETLRPLEVWALNKLMHRLKTGG